MKNAQTSAETSGLAPDLLSAVDEIHQRFSDGEHVSLDEYLARLPQHEETLRQLFATFQFMNAYADFELGSTTTPTRTQNQGKQIGEFTVVREVGRGGMGVVYEAYQGNLDRRVALKILPLAGLADQRQITRFKNEARAAATLHHNNIVPIHSVGIDQGIHYYAMQYIDGPSLADVIRELQSSSLHERATPKAPTKALSPTEGDLDKSAVPTYSSAESETLRVIYAGISTSRDSSPQQFFRTIAKWMDCAADALSHAHENGVVHRDIKPGNLMIDKTGHIWITDFGLARLEADASLTATGDMLGTLRYMSPEQITGDRLLVDHRTDIYSLGLTLFELLALRPAFPENDRATLLKQISLSDPPTLRQIDERIPVDLETIVLKAIEKSPQDRYRSAAEMAEDLHCFLEQRPILAKPPRMRDRVLKWLRRHPAIAKTVAAASVVLLLVTSGFALALNQQQRETARQRDTARAERDEADRQKTLVIAERDRVKQEGDRANNALQLAITTMDEFFSELGEKWIAEDREFSSYQVKLLYRAAEILPKIAGNYPRNEKYFLYAGLAHSRAGNALMRVREFVQARDNLEKSKELLLAALASGDEEKKEIRQELAWLEFQLGQVAISSGEYSAAAERFSNARKLWTELKNDFPGDDALRRLYTIRAAQCEFEELRLMALQLQEDMLLSRLDSLIAELKSIWRNGSYTADDLDVLIVELLVLKSESLRRLGRFEEAQEACAPHSASWYLSVNLDLRDRKRAMVAARLEFALTQIELGKHDTALENLETALAELRASFLFDGTPKDFAFAAMGTGQGIHVGEPFAFTLYARIQSRLALLKSRLGEAEAARELLFEARATCGSEFESDRRVAQFAFDLMFCTEILPNIEPLSQTELLQMLDQCLQFADDIATRSELDAFHKSQYSMILAAKGKYWRAQQRHEDALDLFQRAHAMQLEIAEQVPGHPMLMRRLDQLRRLIQAEQKSVDLSRASRVASYQLKGSFLLADEERYTPWSLAPGPDLDNNQIADQLFVVDGQNKRVLRYSTNGEAKGELVVQRGKWGVMGTYTTAIGPDANLYVVDGAARAIMRFDSTSGLPLGADSAPESAPATFVAAGVGGLQQPLFITFDNSGDLYVSSMGSVDGEPCNEILQFHGPSSPQAGQPIQVFIDKTAGLRMSSCMAFGSDGYFYVTDSGSQSLLRFDAKSGAAVPAAGRRGAELVPEGLGGLKNPKGFRFHDVDGDNQLDLIVTSETQEILCFDPTNGNFKGVLINLAGTPWDIEMLNQDQMIVAVDNTPAQPGDVLIYERH